MGRSASPGDGGKKIESPQAKRLGGILAVVLALVCSAFGIAGVAAGGGDSGQASGSAQAASQAQTTSSSQDASETATELESEAAESRLTFRSEERLEQHFEKHGAELGYATAADYLAGANAVVANPRALHKTQAADGDDAYFLEDTGEFVVVSTKGYIRTYFLATRDYWERQ